MDMLGWPQPVPPFGHVLTRDSKDEGAIVAMGNRPNPPNQWAAIAGGYKTVLTEGEGDTLHIVQLRDTDDKKLNFSNDPARWHSSFAAAARLQLHLRAVSQTIRMASIRAATP